MNIEQILSQMTLREKIGQTVQLQISKVPLHSETEAKEFFEHYPVGSLFAGPDVIQTFGTKIHRVEAIEMSQKLTKIPLSVAGDLECGWGKNADFPSQLALAASKDPSLAYEYGRWTAIEGRKSGFNWAFAPVADIAINWLNPLTNARCLGDDPEFVAEMIVQIVRGMQDYHLSAAAKHFPGDGVDLRDQHLSLSINSLSRKRWMETFGIVYKRAFAEKVDSIMTGHIALPFVDPPSGSRNLPLPATLSPNICRNFLRKELGFEGVVVSDALIMSGFVMYKPYEKRIVDTFAAGTDVLLWPELDYFDLLENAVRNGTVAESLLDESVRRILEMKLKQGLFDPAAAKLPEPIPQIGSRKPDGRLIAREVAERGSVLVRNTRNLIPFVKEKTKNILLWIAACNSNDPNKIYSELINGLESHGAKVTIAVNGNCLDLYHRECAGERYDAVLFVFSQGMHDVKNTIRPTGDAGECLWTLNDCEHHSPIVIGMKSPYLLYENPGLETLINTHSNGAETQKALVRLLYGEIPFTGSSPVSLNVSVGVQE